MLAGLLILLSVASCVCSPDKEHWVFPDSCWEEQAAVGGSPLQDTAQASPRASGRQGARVTTAPQPGQRCWCGRRGSSLKAARVDSFSGSGSMRGVTPGAAHVVVKARGSAFPGCAAVVGTLGYKQTCPRSPPLVSHHLDLLPAAESAPVQHQVLLQPHAVQPLHLPDGGADPPGLRLRG